MSNASPKPKKPGAPKPKRGRWGLFFFSGCLLSGMLGAGTAFGLKQAGFIPEHAPEITIRERPQVFTQVERTNILILGTDVEYTHRGRLLPSRSDTMLVASLDPEENRINVVTVPRDTRVQIPGRHGHDKINAALAYGGPMLAAQAVSDLLQVPIHHWVVVKLDGVEALVNALGGIEIDVERNMYYVDRAAGLRISLKKGRQVLDGEKALQYLRFRHDAYGDIGRVQRQQRFLQAVVKKLLEPMTITRLPQLLDVFRSNVETTMSPGQMLRLANWGKGLAMDEVRMAMVPGEFSGEEYVISYWLPDVAEARRIARSMLGGEAEANRPAIPAEVKRETRISVLNGTGRTGIANEAAQLLRTDGWTVWTVSNYAQSDVPRTRIIAQKREDALGEAIAFTLGVEGEPQKARPGEMQTDFTVVLGHDFLEALRNRRVSRAATP